MLWGCTHSNRLGLLNDKMSISSPKHLIFDILSVVGGVPRYLEEIRPSLTVDENMRRMCFLKQGLLFREFDETFNAVFGSDAIKRRAVLEALSGGSMKASAIAGKLGVAVNGHLTRTLKELEYAGFVARESNLNVETGKPARIDRYRICDNYTRFLKEFQSGRLSFMTDVSRRELRPSMGLMSSYPLIGC